MPHDETELRSRVAQIFRDKDRYLAEQRRREAELAWARRAHAEAFHQIATQIVLPVFEAIGVALASHGLEHRIKRAGLIEAGRFEDAQHVTLEFRFKEEAGASSPLLGRAFLRIATDLGSRALCVHSEIAGGPDTPFAASFSRAATVEPAGLDAAFVQAAALDLVERAVRSTYCEPEGEPDAPAAPR